MTNTDKELDEILWYPGLDQKEQYDIMRAKIEALIHRHQNQLLDKLLEEVIGEDEAFEAEPSDEWEYASLVGQNKLRATQREAINKLRSSK